MDLDINLTAFKIEFKEEPHDFIQKIISFNEVLKNFEDNDNYLINNSDPDIFAERITKLRKQKDMTQQELAVRLNISKQVIWRIEHKKNKTINKIILNDILKIFNVSVYYILGYVNDSNGKLSKVEKYNLEYPNNIYKDVIDKLITNHLLYLRTEKIVPVTFLEKNSLESMLEDVEKCLRNISLSNLYAYELLDIALEVTKLKPEQQEFVIATLIAYFKSLEIEYKCKYS